MAANCAAQQIISTRPERPPVAPLPSSHSDARRGASVDRLLPAEGRPGAAPDWPTSHTPSEDELTAWESLWALPQAVAWESLPGAAHVVARYVRLGIAVDAMLDAGEPAAALVAQLRGLEADLGMSPAALARLRWRIVDKPKPKPTPKHPSTPQPPVRRLRPAGTT